MTQNDIYEKLYNALKEIGLPSNYAGYEINYYQAVPIDIEKHIYDGMPEFKDDYDSMKDEAQDCNQAEIIVNDDYPVEDKIKQMWYILHLLDCDKVVELELGEYHTNPIAATVKPKTIRKPKPVSTVEVVQGGLFNV